MVTNLRNKKVLITAGPTWVKIDSVRVISNTATGSMGILLAKKFIRLGAKVTLLLGPVVLASDLNKKIRLLHFQYFDQLEALLKKELSIRKYDLAIHTAAVSDFRPKLIRRGKISSSSEELNIKLIPTLKIIDIFKKIHPSIYLVGFKFEPEASQFKLISEARRLIYNTQADLVVANTTKAGRYIAYLVTDSKRSAPIFTKKDVVDNLIKAITRK